MLTEGCASATSPPNLRGPGPPSWPQLLAPGLLRFQQLFPLRKTPPRTGGLGTRAAPRLRHLPPSFMPAPSKAPSQPLPPHPLRGLTGGRQNPLPALSQGGKPPAQRCHGPCGMQRARVLRDGERLSRALPPRTERRHFGARKAVADPPPSRPSPPPAHPSDQQECVAGTARLPPPARISPPRPAPGTTRTSRMLSVRKRRPQLRAVQGEQGHQGPLECRERSQARERGRNVFGRNLESPLPVFPVPHTLLGWGRIWRLCPGAMGLGDKNPSG